MLKWPESLNYKTLISKGELAFNFRNKDHHDFYRFFKFIRGEKENLNIELLLGRTFRINLNNFTSTRLKKLLDAKSDFLEPIYGFEYKIIQDQIKLGKVPARDLDFYLTDITNIFKRDLNKYYRFFKSLYKQQKNAKKLGVNPRLYIIAYKMSSVSWLNHSFKSAMVIIPFEFLSLSNRVFEIKIDEKSMINRNLIARAGSYSKLDEHLLSGDIYIDKDFINEYKKYGITFTNDSPKSFREIFVSPKKLDIVKSSKENRSLIQSYPLVSIGYFPKLNNDLVLYNLYNENKDSWNEIQNEKKVKSK